MLATNKDMLVPARRDGYAVGAFNVSNLETALTLAEAVSLGRSWGQQKT